MLKPSLNSYLHQIQWKIFADVLFELSGADCKWILRLHQLQVIFDYASSGNKVRQKTLIEIQLKKLFWEGFHDPVGEQKNYICFVVPWAINEA